MALFRQEGTVWQLTLSHEEVGHVQGAAAVGAMIGTASQTPLRFCRDWRNGFASLPRRPDHFSGVSQAGIPGTP